MKNSARSLLIWTSFVIGPAASLSAVAVAVGCGSSSAAGPSVDASGDQTTDAPGEDTSTGDAAPDNFVTSDGGLDGPGIADGGLGALDAGPNAPSATSFIGSVAQTLCARIAECCFLDAGTFLTKGCLNAYGTNPLGLGQVTAYVDSGVVAYDPAKAANCIREIEAFPCGTVSSATSIGIQQDCSAAFRGLIVDGGACQSNTECSSGNYCTVPAEGGVGSCAPLLGDGGHCTRSNNSECSYLGLGVPGMYCDTTLHECLPQLEADASCVSYQQCATQICRGTPSVCGNQLVFTDPGVVGGTCDRFTVRDAGGE